MKKKVLLVESVRSILERQIGLLERDIFQVLTATSGREALEVHKNEKADIIIMDLHMPGMGGDEVCKTIRKDPELKNVSVVLVTLLNSQDEIRRCNEAGANDFVKKPIDKHELAEKIAKLLGIPVRQSIRILVKVKIGGRLGDEFFLANTVDVSTSGLLFECDRGLTVGEGIEVSFFIPGASEFNRVVARAEVMRMAPSNTKMMRYGVKFNDFKEGNPVSIGDFIARKTRR